MNQNAIGFVITDLRHNCVRCLSEQRHTEWGLPKSDLSSFTVTAHPAPVPWQSTTLTDGISAPLLTPLKS